MKELYITVVENGFIVNEHPTITGAVGKQWVFQDSEGLSDFIGEWGTKALENS